jgi:REP-associated tyrosine transposase
MPNLKSCGFRLQAEGRRHRKTPQFESCGFRLQAEGRRHRKIPNLNHVASAFRRKIRGTRKIHGTERAFLVRMSHPYPPHWVNFSYVGRYQYCLTCVTLGRRPVFKDVEGVNLVLPQILRAAAENHFALIAYCFMPDHLHLIASGENDDADCKAFIKAGKQYSAYYYSRVQRMRLWERYGHDRVIRDDMELAMTIGYVVANPVTAGLVKHPRDYPFLGSTKYAIDELLRWCEYPETSGHMSSSA